MITEKARRQSLKRFGEFLKEIIDGDWEYGDGSPMTKDAQVVLDTLTPISTDDELPPEHADILWWLPAEDRSGWQLGFYGADEHYPPGGFVSGGCHWFVCDGPTWWMYPPPSPEGESNEV